MLDDSPTDLNNLLFQEEKRFVTGDFREYFLKKRHNFIATANVFNDLSDLYFQTDQNWINALTILGDSSKDDWAIPIMLTNFCFRELRLSAELLLSCCITPGNSHLRTAIESFAQAQKILREPHLDKVWCRRDEDRAEYDKHFKKDRKKNLFPDSGGFTQLHALWTMLCDTGPHPNVTSVGISSSTTALDTSVVWSLDFFEVDQRAIAENLLIMLTGDLEMFKHTYAAFHERLSLHPQFLPELHSQLQAVEQLKKKYAPRQI
jgi:hypothetical protein